jgi:hypothetical protein
MKLTDTAVLCKALYAGLQHLKEEFIDKEEEEATFPWFSLVSEQMLIC